MNKPDLTIIQSPEAERMRQMVTEGFYDRSRLGLWLFEVIGREWDDCAKWARTLKQEIFPLSCTWSIEDWEFVYGYEPDPTLPLDFRRRRLLMRRILWPPINPARIEALLSGLLGLPVEITDPIRGYTFRVDVFEDWNRVVNHKYAIEILRTIKPSHLSYEWRSRVLVDYEVTDYSAGAIGDLIREYFIGDVTEIVTEITDYSAGLDETRLTEYLVANE